ncbi:hypothetical protein [Corynebacterium halotolerans]|uniref:Uncharacterized protein n=1 Tax=Corynebacterium halotolerans YIM 70093 = DSM 44683 TaxID=1121362 RepID=M1NT85_9CORY|nr:hypothetical protein [Corynebacterium halotolerans]AGF72687.1 hypothetical protein A605_08425 [Corynebacterium halotolerans YIM 70093 = DSM 44683]
MTVNLVVMPAGPALVRELAPADSVGEQLLAAVSTLVDAALSADPARTVELVGSRDPRWETGLTGSFAAWGAPQVQVGAGTHLPELVQRYALGGWTGRIADTRANLQEIKPHALTVVAVDGSAGLTQRAPLALIDAAAEADEWCRDVLSGTRPGREMDPASLRGAGVLEPDLWLELAALRPRRARLLAADTTLGVGRYVAAWEV